MKHRVIILLLIICFVGILSVIWQIGSGSRIDLVRSITSDTTPHRYAALEAKLFPIHERYGWPNELQPEYPEHYEPRIVLHLPGRIATRREYRVASDTEKAGHWWIDSNGMTLEGKPGPGIYGFRPPDPVKWGGDTPIEPFNQKVPILRTDRYYSFIPYFGIDSNRFIYLMPENEIGIRVYSPDGAYLRTLHKRDSGYAAARAIVSSSWYGQCREFLPAHVMVGFSERSRMAITNLSEIGGPSDSVILSGGLQAQYARHIGHGCYGTGIEGFLDAIDEEHNFYGYFIFSEDLSRKSRNPLTRLGSNNLLQRNFITKYNRHGRLLAEMEVLPCYHWPTFWDMEPERGHRYVKVISASEIYFMGITYLDDSLDIYVIRYQRLVQ